MTPGAAKIRQEGTTHTFYHCDVTHAAGLDPTELIPAAEANDLFFGLFWLAEHPFY